jgi:RNA polymerase primary sigma factor
MTTQIPVDLIDTVNTLVRTSRRMFIETGREPTPEELAERLAMSPERVRKLLDVARQPIGHDR